MKDFLDFLTKHKSFVKKIILFVIYTIIVCVLNNDSLTLFFNQIFGEHITDTIGYITPYLLMVSEVN